MLHPFSLFFISYFFCSCCTTFFIFYFLFLLLVISISPCPFLPVFSTNGNLPHPKSRPSRFFSPTCPRGPRRPFSARACTHRCLDHAALHALNAICVHCMSGAIIPALITRSHQNSAVKRARARVVLSWVTTTWEVLMLNPFLLFFTSYFFCSCCTPFFIFYFLFLLLVISISPRPFLPVFSTNGNLPYPRSRPSRFFSPTCSRGPGRPFPARACTHRCLDHAAPHALNVISAHCMSGAIIPALMHWIPSKLCS